MTTFKERSIAGAEIVMTGATNGIGKEIARSLVRRGAALTLIARSETKGLDTADELAEERGASVRPRLIIADLADLGSVRRAAAELGSHLDRVDVLVNNAGILALSGRPTVDGYDSMVATNHLGPFLLTTEVLELLRVANSARIVTTASEAHRVSRRPDPATFARPRTFGSGGAQRVYGESKLLNILFTAELARRLTGTGVTANCFCPGAVASGLNRESGFISRAGPLAARTPFVRTPVQGAQMGLRLVLDPDLDGVSGKFFSSTPGMRFVPRVSACEDANLAQQLWSRSAELVRSANAGDA